MSTPDSTSELLRRLAECRAIGSVPVLVGNTADLFISPEGPLYDLPTLLAVQAAETGTRTVSFSLAAGSRDLNPGGRLPGSGVRHVRTDDGADAALADLLDQLATLTDGLQLLVNYSDLLIPATAPGDSQVGEQERVIELLAEQALQQAARRTPHHLVVLTRAGAGVDPRLAALPSFTTVTVPRPNLPARAAALTRLTGQDAVGGTLQLEDGLQVEESAALTGGMRTFDLVQARARSVHLGEPLTRAWIQSQKSQAIDHRGDGSLQILPSGDGLADVAGLPQMQLLYQEYLATGLFPRRLLLVGPPGVGKTLVVRSIGRDLGMPVVRLGAFRSMWYGESERHQAEAFDTIAAMAPCIVLLDEIDQDGGVRSTGPSGDGGVSARLLAALWGFLGDSDRRDGVIVMATSNRPDLIDTALFDRFEIVPVLHPTPGEAAEVMAIAARREGADLDPGDAEEAIRAYGQLLTGRILVDVTDRALTLARIAHQPLGLSHLSAAFGELMAPVPAAQHERLGLLALAHTSFASRLPWRAAAALQQTPTVPYYVEPYLTHDGRLDMARLAADLAL